MSEQPNIDLEKEKEETKQEEQAGKTAFNLIAYSIANWKNLVGIIVAVGVVIVLYGLVMSSWSCGKIQKGTAPIIHKAAQ